MTSLNCILQLNFRLICLISIVPPPAYKISVKILTINLIIALDIRPLIQPEGSMGWGKIFDTVALGNYGL